MMTTTRRVGGRIHWHHAWESIKNAGRKPSTRRFWCRRQSTSQALSSPVSQQLTKQCQMGVAFHHCAVDRRRYAAINGNNFPSERKPATLHASMCSSLWENCHDTRRRNLQLTGEGIIFEQWSCQNIYLIELICCRTLNHGNATRRLRRQFPVDSALLRFGH